MNSTPEMRARIRELATPPRDDFDRGVLAVLDDLDTQSASASPVSLDAEAMEIAGRALYGCKTARKSNALARQRRVAAALTAATMREREACAQMIEECCVGTNDERLGLRIVAAIRARSAPPKEGK